jgi:hypothetical protein
MVYISNFTITKNDRHYIPNEIITVIDIILHNIRDKKSRLLKDPGSPLVIKGQQFVYSFRLKKHEYIGFSAIQRALIETLERDSIIIDNISITNYRNWVDKITCNKSHNSYSITIKYHIMNRELLDTHIDKNLTPKV